MTIEGQKTIQNEDVDEQISPAIDKEAEALETIQEEDVTPEKPVLPRDEMMAKLSKQRAEENEERRKLNIEQGFPQPSEEEEAKPTEEISDDETVDLKVLGEVITKPKKEVEEAGGIEKVQKTLSAEKKLKIAAKKKRELDEREEKARQAEEDILRREHELSQRIERLEKEATKTVDKVEEDDTDLDAEADKLFSSIYSGKEEEGKEALKKILKKKKQEVVKTEEPKVDEDKIVHKTVFEAERTLGQRELANQFPHLINDDDLFAMTNKETARLFNENPKASPYDIILQAGKNIDAWAKKVVADENDDEQKDIINERVESKRNIHTVKTAKGRKEQDSGFKPKSKAEIFEEYRKGRPRQ